MSLAAHHAAEQQEHHFPTASSAQSSDIHADPQQYGGKAERYDDDGILLESAEPSRQVVSSAQLAQSAQKRPAEQLILVCCRVHRMSSAPLQAPVLSCS